MSTGKIRVYEIAKKIGVSSKELIEKLNKNGFDVKNHMSGVDVIEATLTLDTLGSGTVELEDETEVETDMYVKLVNYVEELEIPSA